MKRDDRETPRSAPARPVSWYGSVALAVGLTGLTGYFTHQQVLLEFIPGLSVPMVLASALCMTLCGVALCLSDRHRWTRRSAETLMVVVTGIAGLALSQQVLSIDTGINLPELHAWLSTPGARTGGMGLDTALAFLGVSIAFLLGKDDVSRGRARLVRGLIGAVLVLAILGILGAVLTIDFLYTWPILTRLALPTSLGLLALAMALQQRCNTLGWIRSRPARDFSEQLTLDAEIFLVAVAAAAGLVAFAVLQSRVEHLVSDQLRDQLENRASSFASTIGQFEERTAMIASRPGVIQLNQRIAQQPADQAARDSLEAIARSFLPHGFTGVRMTDTEGKVLASIGTFRAKPELVVDLRSPQAAQLMWDDGFYLRATEPIQGVGKLLGSVTTEQPIQNLTRLNSGSSVWSESGEVILCAIVTSRLACFPTRFQKAPFYAEAVPGEARSPMRRALDGEISIAKVADRNGQRVLAAYRPVGNTGLGMVMKIDLVEIYRPIRESFQLILPLLVLLVVAGALLLRWRLRPILGRIAESRRAVVDSENRFRIACESGIDAFMILESVRSTEGTVVDFRFSYVNRNAEKMLRLPRGQILEQSLAGVLPRLTKSGWLDRCKKVVDSGRPNGAEQLLESPDGHPMWVHQHIVPLGDGVAVTISDINERKRLEEELRRMAQTDPLTALPNRALFLDRVEHAMVRSRGDGQLLAVLAVDIDHFQTLNKDYGHSGGDAVLKTFASRLTEAVRAEDTVGRIGADQFGVILERLNGRSQAFSTAESVLAGLRAEIPINETGVSTSASIGVAIYAGESTTALALLERASAAVLEVKRRGGNGYFAAEMNYDESEPRGISSGS